MIGVCCMCGMDIVCKRRTRDTCSARCRKAKERHPERVKDFPRVNLFNSIPPDPAVKRPPTIAVQARKGHKPTNPSPKHSTGRKRR